MGFSKQPTAVHLVERKARFQVCMHLFVYEEMDGKETAFLVFLLDRSIFLCHCQGCTKMKRSLRQRQLSCKCAGCKTSYQFPFCRKRSLDFLVSSGRCCCCACRALDCFCESPMFPRTAARSRQDGPGANNLRRSDMYMSTPPLKHAKV